MSSMKDNKTWILIKILEIWKKKKKKKLKVFHENMWMKEC